ncbi:MAG: MFS transporter [Betaproteobacteria bacterium]|nr:MFS transporter [Betaproteobacteria bacterium]MDH3437957.1 MFS transporter [Betaproteobacteria bacterium]
MTAENATSRLTLVLALGFTQTIAWASSTYLPAILAQPVAGDLGLSASTVFGAFSVSLIVMAIAGPSVGRAIDRSGGRNVLVLSNLVLASGLILLGFASSVVMVFGAWCVLGVGMAMGLYDAAFATLVRIHAGAARTPITGITLIAGFASTVGWPLTALVAEHFGWRMACFGWAAVNVCVALPLNLLCIPSVARDAHPSDQPDSSADGAPGAKSTSKWSSRKERRAFVLLALFSAATAFVTSAMAAHLPGLLLAAGATTVAALTAAALLGPAQVAARLLEFLAAHRFSFHPLLTARIATALHPVGALVLGTFGGVPLAASGFAMLHGAGNGMITIAKGTLPLAIFGPAGYGLLQGMLGVLARAMQALAPYAFGLVLETFGVRAAIGLSAGLSLVALGALLGLRAKPTEPPRRP